MKKEEWIQTASAKRVDVDKLEARDIAGYEVQPRTENEIHPWLNEQAWPEASCSKPDKGEPR